MFKETPFVQTVKQAVEPHGGRVRDVDGRSTPRPAGHAHRRVGAHWLASDRGEADKYGGIVPVRHRSRRRMATRVLMARRSGVVRWLRR